MARHAHETNENGTTKMTTEILIAGFGGQGVLSLGKILAYAAVLEGREVSWLPSYGPEQRGGTCNVTVVVSDERISSPIVDSFDIVITLNQQSLSKFESKVKPNGILIYDTYGIVTPPQRTDINIYTMKAAEKARAEGIDKMLNMVVAGAVLSISPLVEKASIEAALQKVLPERYHSLIAENCRALELGVGCV